MMLAVPEPACQAITQISSVTIAVFKALGGGWAAR
jgi:hypothetical protein